MTRMEISIRPTTAADHDWVRQKMVESWGAEIVVGHGTIYRPADLPGLVAELSGAGAGLLTYSIRAGAGEIVTLDAWIERRGIGSGLIEEVKKIAVRANCRRLWLITTNNNTHALQFYQKHGFVLSALRVNEIEKSRLLKPEIPLLGIDGIPIRDELELEMPL
jgi:GNAT superfamily N-acetyltransferase